MTLAILLGSMAIAAGAFVLLPLLRKRTAADERAAFDRAVYRDQLEELDRDLERGLIGAAEASAARTEIERRILATAADAPKPPAAAGGAGISTPARAAIITLAVILPATAAGLYLVLGAPGLPDRPFADRPRAEPGPAGPSTAPIEMMVAMVERRLAEKPEELQGWAILSTAYLRLGRLEDAETALARALELAGTDNARAASIAVNYGEALVALHGGQVVPAAKAAFERALVDAPKDPAARYYMGLALLQAGDAASALAAWRRIVAEAPAEAPWLPQLKQRIETVAKERGLAPEGPGGAP